MDTIWAAPMDAARLFQSGRSQAVRLPKDYRFSGSEVAVQHFGNGVLLLLPIDDPWQTLEEGLAQGLLEVCPSRPGPAVAFAVV